MNVCVYCASSTQIAEQYLNHTSLLGKILATNSITTIYGGGSVGSMGALANAVLANGGKIIGVIPKFMMELEWGNSNVTQMMVVESMAERKLKLIENADAVVALPGGTGTLEELSEVISLKKLGLFTKPIIILNTNGFYNYFIAFLHKMAEENFINEAHKQLFSVIASPEEILNAIARAPLWNKEIAKNFAAL